MDRFCYFTHLSGLQFNLKAASSISRMMHIIETDLRQTRLLCLCYGAIHLQVSLALF